MIIKHEKKLSDIEFNDDLKDIIKYLTKEDFEVIDNRLNNIYTHGITEIELNNLFRHNFTTIVQVLGYDDADDFLNQRKLTAVKSNIDISNRDLRLLVLSKSHIETTSVIYEKIRFTIKNDESSPEIERKFFNVLEKTYKDISHTDITKRYVFDDLLEKFVIEWFNQNGGWKCKWKNFDITEVSQTDTHFRIVILAELLDNAWREI